MLDYVYQPLTVWQRLRTMSVNSFDACPTNLLGDACRESVGEYVPESAALQGPHGGHSRPTR